MKCFKTITFLLTLCTVQWCFALNPSNEEVITHIIYDYVKAWNENECRGFADHFAPESDFVNIFGMHFRGREAIGQRHIDILQTFLKGSLFTITNLEFREVNPNTVLAFVRWKVDGFHRPGTDMNGPGETIQGIFSHVFFNEDGSWEIIATQNTLSR